MKNKVLVAPFSKNLESQNSLIEGDNLPRTVRPLKKTPIKPLNERVLLVSPEISETRLNICKSCESFDDWACKITNNFMPKTTRQKGMHCPKGYWSSNWE